MTGAEAFAGIGAILTKAFPSALARDAESASSIIPIATLAPIGEFTVRVGHEYLVVPSRFYNEEPRAEEIRFLNERQQLLLHAFYTRHHDGYVRQRHLQAAVGSVEPWVPPYVISLIGEYVLEIVESVASGLAELENPSSRQREVYGRFVDENPSFIDLIEARTASYWNEYYRSQFIRLADYPGRVLVANLRLAAKNFPSN